MKKILLPLLLLFSFTSLFAQPSNDECATLIDLGTTPLCPDDVWFTNVDATETNIGSNNFPMGCDGGDITFSGRDVFFQFKTDATLLDLNITVTGSADPMGSTPITNPQVALFRGDCLFDELSLLKCGKAEADENEISIDVFGLDPNTLYYLRINDWAPTATPNSGSFQICIGEQDPEFTLCDNNTVASAGVLYDCGGPDEDYDSNSNESFTICPDELTAVNGCIVFSLEYFNLETSAGIAAADFITFYDGPDTNSPVISNIGNNSIGDDGGGGVCYVAQASSGCLTVQLTSNASVEFEGFAGAWETFLTPCEPVVSIEFTADPTDEELSDYVTSPSSIATITNIDCASEQYGIFTATDSDLGLERGIILASGPAINALGPNTLPNTENFNPLGNPGDDDLDALSALETPAGGLSQDACVVELDVFVATNQLSFEYVFGSEEYPEFVNSTFNDIFALMVSGPGITGDPGIGDQKNIATLPSNNAQVAINSVNPLENSEYYRYNTGGQGTEYDGLTSDFLGVKKSLTATIPVTPCTTYHLKFAIADRSDGTYDSGVFIGELKGDVPEIAVNFASGVDYLIEDCTGNEDILIITLDNPQDETLTYDIIIGGTATPDVDYTLDIPTQVTIPAGTTELSYPLIPLSDALTEGIETITITMTSNFGCGDVELNEITIELHDVPLVEIFAGVDTAFVCEGSCLPMQVDGASTYEWVSTFPGVFDDPTSPNPIACPTQSQWVSVTGTIDAATGCFDTDSVFLQFVDPSISIVANSTVNICNGESVSLTATNNVNNTGLSWTPGDFLSADDEANVIATPPETQTYIASVTVSGCTVQDQITINVNEYDPPILTTTDTLLCEGSVLQLADSIETTTTVYQWSPEDYIISATNISGAVAIPEDNIVYTIISNSQDDFCRDTFEVNVTVLPAEIDIDNGDYLELCLGESVELTTTNSTNGVGIVWTPDNSTLDTLEGPTVVASPTETTTYFATLTIGGCVVTDSVLIRVDSLPSMPIDPLPLKEFYCLDEIVFLTSPSYIDEDYPDIMHLWTPVIGQNSDTTNYNLNISATETFTYTRITTNHACSESNSMEIIVIDPNDIILMPTDTTVCAGDQVYVSATSTVTENFTWTNDRGAPSTCPEDEMCPGTTVTIGNGPTTVTAMTEIGGCTIMGSVVLEALPKPIIEFPYPQVCEGESIMLNLDVPPGNGVFEWSTEAGPLQPDPNDPNPVVTPTVLTTYYLTLQNDYCPVINDSITINVAGVSTLTVPGDQQLCTGDTVPLSSFSNNLGRFVWSTGDTKDTTYTSLIMFDNTETVANIPVTVTFDNDCPDTPISADFTIDIQAGNDVDLNFDPMAQDSLVGGQNRCYFSEGELVTVDNSNSAGSYNWTFNDNPVSTSSIYEFTALNGGVVKLVLTAPNGCVTEGKKTVSVLPAIWAMPNAFTPDGDNFNDTFTPLFKPTNGMTIIGFQVYDRWGNRVYNNENGYAGWNGTYKGKPMPTDVYMYKIEILRPDGITVIKDSGDLTLIR